MNITEQTKTVWTYDGVDYPTKEAAERSAKYKLIDGLCLSGITYDDLFSILVNLRDNGIHSKAKLQSLIELVEELSNEETIYEKDN